MLPPDTANNWTTKPPQWNDRQSHFVCTRFNVCFHSSVLVVVGRVCQFYRDMHLDHSASDLFTLFDWMFNITAGFVRNGGGNIDYSCIAMFTSCSFPESLIFVGGGGKMHFFHQINLNLPIILIKKKKILISWCDHWRNVRLCVKST